MHTGLDNNFKYASFIGIIGYRLFGVYTFIQYNILKNPIMAELCRVCMENSDLLTDIFAPLMNLQTQHEPEISMADILNELTGCQMIINYNSELPQYICTNCMKGAKAALDFKHMVERNSERFEELHSMSGDQKCKVKLKQEEDDLIAICNMLNAEDLQLMDNLEEEETKELNIKANATHQYNTRRKRLNRYSVSNMSSESFLSESGLDYEDEKKTSLACPHCQYVPSNKGNLKAHLRTHTGERPFQCPHCPRTFTQKQNMTVHTRTHTGERPYKCAACPKSFAQLAGLIAHNRRRPWDHILDSKHVIKQQRLKKHRRKKGHN